MRFDIDQAVCTVLIEAMHPISHRLTIHPADARRLLAAHSVVNRSQGQKSPCLVGVLRLGRHAAQRRRVKILPKPNCRFPPPESKMFGKQ